MQHDFTIVEFCARHRMCRRTFYNRLRDGTGPIVTKHGAGLRSKVTISAEAEAAWMRERGIIPPPPPLPPARGGNLHDNMG
jgi:hypothetical protein